MGVVKGDTWSLDYSPYYEALQCKPKATVAGQNPA